MISKFELRGNSPWRQCYNLDKQPHKNYWIMRMTFLMQLFSYYLWTNIIKIRYYSDMEHFKMIYMNTKQTSQQETKMYFILISLPNRSQRSKKSYSLYNLIHNKALSAHQYPKNSFKSLGVYQLNLSTIFLIVLLVTQNEKKITYKICYSMRLSKLF